MQETLVSEVFDLEELLPIMRKMVRACAADSHFLFIDRSDAETGGKINELIEGLGLKLECSAGIRGNMDTDEDKSVLKDISNFLGRQPRLTWNAVWVLATKLKPDASR